MGVQTGRAVPTVGTPSSLPETFTYKTGAEAVGERQLRNFIVHGLVVSIAPGIYRQAGWNGDEDLAEIAHKSPRATMCLRTALARHGLIDDIPAATEVAIPRGRWTPVVQTAVIWHHFDPRTFDLGRDEVDLTADLRIGLYSSERCIIDAIRLRGVEGPELGIEALKAWLRTGGQASTLLRLASRFSNAEAPLRSALQILL